jgi:hypothetical protein
VAVVSIELGENFEMASDGQKVQAEITSTGIDR